MIGKTVIQIGREKKVKALKPAGPGVCTRSGNRKTVKRANTARR